MFVAALGRAAFNKGAQYCNALVSDFWPHVKGEVGSGEGDDASSEGPSSNATSGGHPTTRLDPVVKKYATQSFRGAQAAFAVLLAWATTFLVGGKDLFGEKLWNQLSVTAQPPLE